MKLLRSGQVAFLAMKGVATLHRAKVGLRTLPPAGFETGAFFGVFRKTNQALQDMVVNGVLHRAGELLGAGRLDPEHLREKML